MPNTATPETICLRTNHQSLRVNRQTGEIRDIALMTAGREAKGHGIYLDDRTLQTGLDAIQEQGGRLRAAIKHPSLMDQLTGRTDRVLDFPGYFSEIEIRGDQLVAGRLDFFDSFKEEHPAEFKRILEMAEKTPDLFGVSVEIGGYLSFVDENGTEFSEPPQGDDVVLKYDGMPVFRITDLPTASFVDRPAANDGLFARFAAQFGIGKETPMAALQNIAKSFIEWSEKHDTEQEISLAGPPAAGELASAPIGEMPNIIAELRERIEDKTRLSSALEIVAEHPDFDADRVIAELASQEAERDRLHLASQVDDLKARLGAMQQAVDDKTIELAEATSRLATTEAERDAAQAASADWQKKFEDIKNSGARFAVNLGTPNGGRTTDILDEYHALEGAEKTAFYMKHKKAIWAARETLVR